MEPGSGPKWARSASAFESMYGEHAPRLRAFLRQLVGSSEAADDLTHDIFMQLWSHPHSFDPTRGGIRAYLLGIGRHRAADWWRRARPLDPLGEDIGAQDDLQHTSLIADVFRRLPEEQRSLLWLREVEGQTYAELAVIFDIPVGTVRSRLFMARQALREIWLGRAKGELHEMR